MSELAINFPESDPGMRLFNFMSVHALHQVRFSLHKWQLSFGGLVVWPQSQMALAPGACAWATHRVQPAPDRFAVAATLRTWRSWKGVTVTVNLAEGRHRKGQAWRQAWTHASLASAMAGGILWHSQTRRQRGRIQSVFRSSCQSQLEALFEESPWRRGLEPAEESKPTRLTFLGRLPEDLVGTVYRNGPGRIRIGESQYGHWFDGDGFVTALTVDGKQQEAAFTSRFVKTNRFEAQQKPEAFFKTERGSGMALMGAWTPSANGDLLSNIFRLPTNPANTNVLWWGDRLLALCEGGTPYALDPGTLETLGQELFRHPSLQQSGVQFFSAHPKQDPESGELFNIGLKIGLEPSLEVYKCSADRLLLERTGIPLADITFVHDFAITREYVVLIIPPWSCSTSGLATSLWKGALGQFFEWKEDAGTRLLVLRRSDLSTVSWYHS